MRTPAVELRWWDGCPSTAGALADLRSALEEVGLDPDAVAVSEVRTDEEAAEQRFPGSPTILIDGEDVQPVEDDEVFGLTCRVYRRRNGRISPTPDPDDIRDALRRAVADKETNA